MQSFRFVGKITFYLIISYLLLNVVQFVMETSIQIVNAVRKLLRKRRFKEMDKRDSI